MQVPIRAQKLSRLAGIGTWNNEILCSSRVSGGNLTWCLKVMLMRIPAVLSLCVLCLEMVALRAVAQVSPTVTVNGGTIVPQLLHPADGVFTVPRLEQITIGKRVKQSEASIDRLIKWFQVKVPPQSGVSTGSIAGNNHISIGLAADGEPYRSLMKRYGAKIPSGATGDEGYVLHVTPAAIELAARKPAGIFYGIMELMSRNTAAAPGLTVNAATIVDWPAMRWRGVQVGIGSREELPQLDELISRYMPELHLNQLVLEVDYHFQYKSHKKMDDPDGLSVADCEQLRTLAAANYIRIIPMIDCLGHQSWAAHTNRLLREYPQFDETPDVPADNSGIYCRSWCPSDPAVYHVVDDLIGELIDAFHADAFNVGMDEVFILGECARCKGTPNDVLFARAVNHLYDYIVKRRHVQMMMWGDRLLDGNKTGYGSWEASTNGTAPAINLIPHDIVICDWHYQSLYNGQKSDFPSVKYFISKGFQVWPTGWNEPPAVEALEDVSLQQHSPRMVGYLASTWVGLGAVVKGLAGDAKTLADTGTANVVASMVVGSQMAWDGSNVATPTGSAAITK